MYVSMFGKKGHPNTFPDPSVSPHDSYQSVQVSTRASLKSLLTKGKEGINSEETCRSANDTILGLVLTAQRLEVWWLHAKQWEAAGDKELGSPCDLPHQAENKNPKVYFRRDPFATFGLRAILIHLSKVSSKKPAMCQVRTKLQHRCFQHPVAYTCDSGLLKNARNLQTTGPSTKHN